MCAGAILFAFHIRRYTWQWGAIVISALVVSVAVGLLVVRRRG